MKNFKDISFYGVGVEWAFDLEKPFMQNMDRIDLLEIIPENFFRQGRNFIEMLADRAIPTVIHGVELSFGSSEPLKQRHLDEMCRVADSVNTIMVSEHLSMTEHGGVEIGQLTPLPWSYELADAVSRKIEQIQRQIDVPFAIENVTNRFVVPNCEISETEFINRVLANTGCGLQLDLNNVDTNAYNFGFDPYQWIQELNLERVISVHLAGGDFDDEGTLLDSHSAPVRQRVWDLYRYVCERKIPGTTIVEWTDDVPPLDELFADVRTAELILSELMSAAHPPVLGEVGL